MYGSELEDDEDEVEEELKAQETRRASESSTQEPAPVPDQPRPSHSAAQKKSNLVEDSPSDTGESISVHFVFLGVKKGHLSLFNSQKYEVVTEMDSYSFRLIAWRGAL